MILIKRVLKGCREKVKSVLVGLRFFEWVGAKDKKSHRERLIGVIEKFGPRILKKCALNSKVVILKMVLGIFKKDQFGSQKPS